MDALTLIPAAFLAGLLMFLAPCTLPIVPGYLAFIAGSGDVGTQRTRLVINAVAFVLGFSLIFILLGTFAGAIGALIGPWRAMLSRVAGMVIILFGFTMLGIVRIPVLGGNYASHIPKFLTLGQPHSSFLIGALFALGWSPCVGPILGTILLFASSSATAPQGALLLAIFSLGLGLPFILTALLLEKASALFAHSGTVTQILSIVGGIVLLVLGVLMLFDRMGLLLTWGFYLLDAPYRSLLPYM